MSLGVIDLRVDAGNAVAAEIKASDLGERGPEWLHLGSARNTRAGRRNHKMRIAFLKETLEKWCFPEEYIASRIAAWEQMYLPGGPFYERNVIVVAVGSMVETIDHSIATYRFAASFAV